MARYAVPSARTPTVDPPAPDVSGVYPSHAQAEQVVSIVGIENAQAGYFGGQTKLMDAP